MFLGRKWGEVSCRRSSGKNAGKPFRDAPRGEKEHASWRRVSDEDGGTHLGQNRADAAWRRSSEKEAGDASWDAPRAKMGGMPVERPKCTATPEGIMTGGYC